MEDGRLLTAAQVAEMLAVTESWVWAHARSGDVPSVRLGRYVRFRRSSVLAWIEQRERS
jgi:excisionase family DNA binding protein